MNERNRDREPFRLGRDVVNAHDKRQQRHDRQVDRRHDGVGPFDDLFEVGARLIKFARADALAHDRRKPQVDCLSCKAVEIAKRVADGVGHHRCRAKGRNEAEEHETAQLEHAVFHAARHTDVEDILHQTHIEAKAAHIREVQHQLIIKKQAKDDGRRHRAGDKRRDRNAGNVHAEAEDQNGVARDVDAVHEKRDLERYIAPPHCAEERRAAVVERDAGDGRHHIYIICIRRRHDIRLDVAEHRRKDLRTEEVEQRHKEERHCRKQRDELLTCVAGVLLVLLSDILSRDRRTARRHRREDVDHQIADRVDQ